MDRISGRIGLLLLVTVTGCAPTYSVRPGAPTATLVSHVANDSSGTTVRTFWTSTTNDGSCKDSLRLHTTLSAGNSYTSEPTTIEAGQRFFVSAVYGDARFGQNRSCAVMASFVPGARRQYKVELQVRDDVRNCSIGIYEVTSGSNDKVPFEMPSHACEDTIVRTNGRPTWINHQYQIQRK
jgi:hypothetical protein